MDTIDIFVNKTNQGKLTLIDYIPVSGVPLKADNYHVIYELHINDIKVEGTFFHDFITDNENIYICEADVDITIDGFGVLTKTSLVKINIQNKSKKLLSEAPSGNISPKRIEGSLIIYTKRFKGNSFIHEFEKSL